MCRTLTTLLCFVGLAAPTLAQGPVDFWGKRIVSIQYQPQGVLHPDDLVRLEVLKLGQPLRSEDIAESIDRLFGTGEFEDVRAEADASGNGVAVRFVTVPVRFISGVSIRGKVIDPPNRGELASVPELSRGDVFHDQDLTSAANSIRRLLTENGLYETTVTPNTSLDSTGQQLFITVRVRYGKRAHYDEPVIHGETKLSMNTIIRATGWRIRFINRWKQVTQARTRAGLAGIGREYQKQDRLSGQVELEGLPYDAKRGRAIPTLTLNDGPRIKVSTTEVKVSQRVLRRYVPIFQERAVDNDLLAEGARNLRDYFQSKGYFDAVVDFRRLMPEPDLETIEYAVSRGQRYKLENLTITGNKYFDEETIRERMFMEPASFHLRRGRYSEAFRKKDEENIANLYRANGFRDVMVTSTRIQNYKGKADQIGIAVRIQEGSQWLVDNVSVNGVTDEERASLEPEFSTSTGQPFSEVSLATDRNRILTLYGTRGYPTASFQAQWAPSDAANHVNVVYTLKPGPQEFVRDVVVTGLRTTRRKLFDERMLLAPGDPLSPTAQANTQKALYDMGLFARVDTAVENPDGDTRYKHLLYALEEANRYTLSLGVGAQVGRFGSPSTTDISSAGGSTGFSPQLSLNFTRLNLFGIGHTASLRGVYSSLQKRANISYFAPRFQNIDGRSLTVALLWDETRDVRTFASRREEASIQVSQRFSRSTTGLFRFSYRRVSVTDVVIPVLLVPQLLQSVRLGVVSGNIARDRRDNSGDPHTGSYNTADLSLAAGYLGSQRNFARVLLRNATYYRLFKNVVFARQTQFGIIQPFANPAGVSEDLAVPLPERFFGGGAESIRAFPYNQAGPRDTGAPLSPGGPSSQPTGFPLGGNALLFNNIELRFPLIGDNIQGVIFHDVGNVYRSVTDFSFRFHQRDLNDFNYAVHAVGFGVRYKTPIGPVRGDIAYSVNPPSYLGFKGTADELLKCGPGGSTLPACQPVNQSISHFQFFFSIGQTF